MDQNNKNVTLVMHYRNNPRGDLYVTCQKAVFLDAREKEVYLSPDSALRLDKLGLEPLTEFFTQIGSLIGVSNSLPRDIYLPISKESCK